MNPLVEGGGRTSREEHFGLEIFRELQNASSPMEASEALLELGCNLWGVPVVVEGRSIGGIDRGDLISSISCELNEFLELPRGENPPDRYD